MAKRQLILWPGAAFLLFSLLLQPAGAVQVSVRLIGLGDSMVHGTMDATNNKTNTENAFLQKVAEALARRVSLRFSQPFFDEGERRLEPFRTPTNLGVDGADVFSVEGLEYYKRVGADTSYITKSYLCDRLFPWALADKYDKVLYPINLWARKDVSQIDAAVWHLRRRAIRSGRQRALVTVWIGNNDSSLAALGSGGKSPTFLPMPFDQVKGELSPLLRLLLAIGRQKGLLSFAPYTMAAIERNLTEGDDFVEQYQHILGRLVEEGDVYSSPVDIVVLTLPYYSSVGYLLDSEDLEFYLRKLNDDYVVPDSFARVVPGSSNTGDRVSLLTFGFMYLLLNSGYSVEQVNTILEMGGRQQDGMVLSEDEQRVIMARIDRYNEAIEEAAGIYGDRVHLVRLGEYLNSGLTGEHPIVVGNKTLSRHWVRGSAFSLDGVHPGYTAQALIANFLLGALRDELGLEAPLYDLPALLAVDPYVDNDEDGWAPGPSTAAHGLTELLFLFKDPDDGDPAVEPTMPPEVWQKVSRVLLGQILGIPPMRLEAERLGIDVRAFPEGR